VSTKILYDSDISKSVEVEQIRLLYSALPLSILAITINASVLAVFQWNVISHSVILTWLICLFIITFARGLAYYAYKKYYIHGINNQKWLNYFSIGVFLSGCIWGSSVIWLFPENEIEHQVFVAFIIAGMSAGATTSLSYHRAYIITFLSLLLIPLMIRFFINWDGISIAIGIMSLAFYIMMMMAGIRNNRYLMENIGLQIESHQHAMVLRESEEKYRHIFNSSPLGIIHYNKNGVVTDYNMRTLEILGVDMDVINGYELLNNMGEEGFHHAISQSLLGELSTYEGKAKSIIGNKKTDIRIFCRGIHTDDQSISGGVALLEDISEDKRIKKLKDELISTISHELRTPLTAIKGAVRLLQEGVVGEMSSSAHDMLNITSVNTERLSHLVNDILDINTLESDTQPYDLKPLNVMEFLEEVAIENNVYAKQQSINIKIIDRINDIFILADHQRLKQVMYNLLSNAVKFSSSNSTVDIAASLENETVVISVIDHGKGIPNEFQPKVFQRFTQADSTDSRQTGGSGLGLSITKGIVDKHFGYIDFTTSNKGTTFSVRLKKCLG
jgi:PAS domain S-box-containing protein